MNEILKMLNALTAEELDSVILRANIILEKKREEEAVAALLEKERQRQEKIAQEKRRQAEIAELQRKLQELQNQKVEIPEEPSVTMGDNFVMYDAPTDNAQATRPKPASPKPQAAQTVSCPHCGTKNVAGSQFCENCGQKISQPKAKPQAAPRPTQLSCPYCQQRNDADSLFCANCGRKIGQGAQAGANSAPRAGNAQVRYAEESMKDWEMHPGERTVRADHEIFMLQPNGGKYAYSMEVTTERILLRRESTGSRTAGAAARMGGGLLGSLLAEGVKAATGAGPKPWLEIPLVCVSECGIRNKKEFFFVADQTYVLKNKRYDTFLPDLVANAKNGRT